MNVPLLSAGQWVPVSDDPRVPAELRREGAYLPHPLPAELWLPPSTYQLVADAEHELGRVDEAANRLAVRDGLVCATRVRDACGSASLAGKAISFRHALCEELLAMNDEGPADPSARALVLPYIRAQQFGLDRVRAGSRIDAALIAAMSAIMTGGLPGDRAELREEFGWLGRDIESAYLLTAGGAHLVGLVDQWSTWIVHENRQPRLAKMAFGHLQLELLQPFPTANGYVARSYTSIALVQAKLLSDQIVPVSVWLDDHLVDYQKAVRAVVDTNQAHRWVNFFARAIREQARAQLNLVTELERTRRELLAKVPSTGYLPQVVHDLIGFPVVNHAVLRRRHGVSEKGATGITRQLVDLEILVNVDDQAYRRLFVCQPVVAVMDRDPATRSDAEPHHEI